MAHEAVFAKWILSLPTKTVHFLRPQTRSLETFCSRGAAFCGLVYFGVHVVVAKRETLLA
jgi:hypothetical protein